MLWWGHMFKPPDRKTNKWKKKKKKKCCGLNLCVWELNKTQVLSRIVPEKKQKKQNNDHNGKSAVIGCLPPNAVLHPALLNRKTSYLMQYLVSNTNMESVSSSKKKGKKYQLSCIYLLDKCKGFLPCVNPVKEKSFFFWFAVNILFISRSVNGRLTELCDLPCLCEESECVCVWGVCWLVSLKQYEW